MSSQKISYMRVPPSPMRQRGGIFNLSNQINIFQAGDLNFRDFKTSGNTDYSWYVTKLTSFNSIKEFTEQLYIFDEGFNAVSISNFRTFKTAP